MKAENSVSVSRFNKFRTETLTLHRGESGSDEISTGTCGSCWSEARGSWGNL